MSEEAIAHRQHIFDNAVGPSPKTTCVVNGIELRALADSGSEVTTITIVNHVTYNILIL